MDNLYWKNKCFKYKSKYNKMKQLVGSGGENTITLYYFDYTDASNIQYKSILIDIDALDDTTTSKFGNISNQLLYKKKTNQLFQVYYKIPNKTEIEIYKFNYKNEKVRHLCLSLSAENSIYFNEISGNVTFIISKNFKFVGKYFDLNWESLSFILKLSKYSYKFNNITNNIEIDHSITLKYSGYRSIINLLLTNFSSIENKNYLRERHINVIKPIFNSSGCEDNTEYKDILVNMAINTILFNQHKNFVILNKNCQLMEFVINSMLASKTDSVKELCYQRTTIIYPYIDKYMEAELSVSDIEFKKNDGNYVKLPSNNGYNILLDTGNSTTAIIGIEIVKNLKLTIYDDKKTTCSGIASTCCTYDKYVKINCRIPRYDVEINDVIAYVSNDKPKMLIFGWNGGLDILREKKIMYNKQNNKSIIAEMKDKILETFSILKSKGDDQLKYLLSNKISELRNNESNKDYVLFSKNVSEWVSFVRSVIINPLFKDNADKDTLDVLYSNNSFLELLLIRLDRNIKNQMLELYNVY